MTSAALSKETPTEFDIHPLISQRWSPRSFAEKKVSRESIHKLLEAMRWAPSAMNDQPWKVVVTEKGTANHAALVNSLMPGNQPWAPDAPILMLVMARTVFSNGSPHHGALYDLGLAVGNLSLQATHLGLSMHQIGGFDKKAVAASLNLEQTTQPVVLIAIGYQDSHEKLPEILKEREMAPRRRKRIDEFAVVEMLEGKEASQPAQ